MNLEHLKQQDFSVYDEIIATNTYCVLLEEIKDKVVFDLGANKGFFSLFCNNFGAKEIIAVEAQPSTFNGLLKENTKGLNNIKLLNYAVTDKSGDKLKLFGNDTNSSLYYTHHSKDGITEGIETISLADLMKDRPETDMVLKMDIEGAEYDIIMNTDKNLLRKFQTIYLEIHGDVHPKYKGQGTKVLEDKLIELGFIQASMKELCNIYVNDKGDKNYVPMGFRISKYTRIPEINEPYILISPFAKLLRNGKENPKNYPYWAELISLFRDKHIIQLGTKGEKQLVSDFKINLSLDEIKKLLTNCEYWISVDSFLQHLAHHVNKKGIVIWSVSDPNIFGYSSNLNIIKDRKYLREKQFDIWEVTTFNQDTFVKAKEVYEKIREQFK